MANEGHLRISRKIQRWAWSHDPQTNYLFIQLLLNANFEDTFFEGEIIHRGDVLTGRKKLAEITGFGEQVIRTSLKRLKSTNTITIKSTNKYSIITICDFDTWQDLADEPNQQTNQQTNQQLTSNQPATNQQLTTSNKLKNKEIKERNNIITPLPPFSGGEGSPNQELLDRLSALEAENEKLRKKVIEDNELDLSIVSEQMRPIVDEWLAYKRQKRQTYKPRGFVTFYNKFVKDCGGDPVRARRMIEHSMANNYDGVFPLKGEKPRPEQSYTGEEDYSKMDFTGWTVLNKR